MPNNTGRKPIHHARESGRITALVASLAIPPALAIAPLNDTGIDFCGDETTNTASCENANFPRQDAKIGRDAQARAETLTKIGGGGKGFDFTKIANNGTTLPASAALGPGPSDWACTRDNRTGLMWEVKVNNSSHLRHRDWTYTWYDSAHDYFNNGNYGTPSGGTCKTAGRCDTEKFVADVNAAGLCGYKDWRMPDVQELQSIVDYGRVDPAINPTYFPNTLSDGFWPSSPSAGSSYYAWYLYFRYGHAHLNYRYSAGRVRLVRGGQ